MADFSDISALDGSFAVNSPRTIDLRPALRAFFGSRKQALIDHDKMTTDLARKIAAAPVVNHLEYHLVESDDPAVWDALLKPIEEDRIRVVGVFHGFVPETVRSRVHVLDVGDSVTSRASKRYLLSLGRAIETGKALTKDGWQYHHALTALCYEVLYGASHFDPKVVSLVPVFLAQQFFSDVSKSGWNDSEALNRVNLFISTVKEFRA